jgi:hypothetical protein
MKTKSRSLITNYIPYLTRLWYLPTSTSSYLTREMEKKEGLHDKGQLKGFFL